jgi:hypothetical protein
MATNLYSIKINNHKNYHTFDNSEIFSVSEISDTENINVCDEISDTDTVDTVRQEIFPVRQQSITIDIPEEIFPAQETTIIDVPSDTVWYTKILNIIDSLYFPILVLLLLVNSIVVYSIIYIILYV